MKDQAIIYQPIDKEIFAEKGEAIFRIIEEKLKPEHVGKVVAPLDNVISERLPDKTVLSNGVAIEIESGDYFLGRTGSEAVEKAKKKYPNKIFYLARVGARAAVSFRRRMAR